MKLENNIYKIENFKFEYPFSENIIELDGSFQINKGDIILLTGDSGSGKSTLLYALKGFIPDIIFGKMSGNILFKEKVLSELTDIEKSKIGFLFQNPDAQMVNITVRQELAFGMENLGFSKDKIIERISYYSKEFEIENLIEKNLDELSGGEKQKIALVSIISMEPEVILFDEPTAFLDPVSAKHFIEVFQKLTKDKTIIIIEHNLNYLKNYIKRNINITKKGFIFEENIDDIKWENHFDKINNYTAGKEILKINNLSFAYKKNSKLILNGIDFSLRQGEIIGITGSNGSGKSTFLKLVSGLLKNKGEMIYFNGIDINKINYKNYFKKIALLFQNPENHFIFDNVLKEINYKTELLEICDLINLELRNPFTLSEGQKRRLSLAILWALDRDIYLLDEPTFGQDYNNKIKLIKMIESIRNNGKSFIIVSHDLPFLKSVSNKILNLKNGKFQNE